MPPRLLQAVASASRFSWLFPNGHDPASLSGNCEARLLDPNPDLDRRWNAGCFAPVTLTLAIDGPARSLGLCPETDASAEISMVIVNSEAPSQRTGYIGPWRDKEWLDIALPFATSCVRIEFVSLEGSWIALRAVRFSA